MTGLIIFLFAMSAPMIDIPGGIFSMPGDGPAAPPRDVTLKAFRIDQYEVTNEDFAKRFPSHHFRSSGGRHPVTRVTFEEAADYCRMEGGRLPTSAEWELAARGPDARIFPWGNKAPHKNPQTYYSGVVKRNVGSDRTDVSYYGLRDMAGSVWEWVDDEAGGKKVARGGMWNLHLDYEYSRITDRILVDPDQRFVFLGFRCAGPSH